MTPQQDVPKRPSLALDNSLYEDENDDDIIEDTKTNENKENIDKVMSFVTKIKTNTTVSKCSVESPVVDEKKANDIDDPIVLDSPAAVVSAEGPAKMAPIFNMKKTSKNKIEKCHDEAVKKTEDKKRKFDYVATEVNKKLEAEIDNVKYVSFQIRTS